MNQLMNACITLLLPFGITSCGPVDGQVWEINNLEQIGGHAVAVIGNPAVVETPQGKAIRFDGDGDQIVVDHNPLGGTTSFTVEVVFQPDACYPENRDPRFIHIQDPGDPQAKRLMIELRLNDQNQCYLDAFLKTDTADLALIDENLTHPTETWLHAAVTYENGVLTTYMNGVKELSGAVGFEESYINPTGKVAIGGRMDQRNWYRGLVKTLKVTPRVLTPVEFIDISHVSK